MNAQIATSERNRKLAAEKAEAQGIIGTLIRETDTPDCPTGHRTGEVTTDRANGKVTTNTNHCGQHWLLQLSDDDLAGAAARVRSQVDRIKVLFADLEAAGAPHRDISVEETLVAETADHVAKEQACRADKQCMIVRQLRPLREEICAATGEIRNMQERIRIEKANPSGVVDLAELHDDGEIIQSDQAIVASKKADYQKLARKSFDADFKCIVGPSK